MKNKDFAKLIVSGTIPEGRHNQHVQIVSTINPADKIVSDYKYHNSIIGRLQGDKLTIMWCEFYTASTAQHINHMLSAVGYQGRRVGYAQDRDDMIASRVYTKGVNDGWYLSSLIYQDGTIESIS